MPLYLPKDFAKACHKSPAHVSMAKKRGKIIMQGDWINTDIPENAIQMQKWLAEHEAKEHNGNEKQLPAKKTAKNKSLTTTIPDTPGKILPPEIIVPEQTPVGYVGLDKEKKEAEIKYKQVQARILELNEAKLRGELIPSDLAGNIIAVLGYSFQTVYKNGSEALLIEISNRMKMDLETKAHFKGMLTDLINKAHKIAIDEAKIGLKNLISETSASDLEHFEDEQN